MTTKPTREQNLQLRFWRLKLKLKLKSPSTKWHLECRKRRRPTSYNRRYHRRRSNRLDSQDIQIRFTSTSARVPRNAVALQDRLTSQRSIPCHQEHSRSTSSCCLAPHLMRNHRRCKSYSTGLVTEMWRSWPRFRQY